MIIALGPIQEAIFPGPAWSEVLTQLVQNDPQMLKISPDNLILAHQPVSSGAPIFLVFFSVPVTPLFSLLKVCSGAAV